MTNKLKIEQFLSPSETIIIKNTLLDTDDWEEVVLTNYRLILIDACSMKSHILKKVISWYGFFYKNDHGRYCIAKIDYSMLVNFNDDTAQFSFATQDEFEEFLQEFTRVVCDED